LHKSESHKSVSFNSGAKPQKATGDNRSQQVKLKHCTVYKLMMKCVASPV